MEALEARIHYTFKNPRLLAEALTHPSLAYETQGPHFDNQRLEFLGDAVLQLILTRKIFLLFPGLDEGSMTKLRSQLVSRTALQRYAQRIELGAYLLMGKGEAASGGRDRPSTLADAVEALVGAIYMDSSLDEATVVVLQLCREEIASLDLDQEHLNPKGRLQEILQATGAPSPSYEMLDQRGPDHRKEFVSRVFWQGEALGTGQGSSKKLAETAAAREALTHPMVLRLCSKARSILPPAQPEPHPPTPPLPAAAHSEEVSELLAHP
jgi:ribonuclease-3